MPENSQDQPHQPSPADRPEPAEGKEPPTPPTPPPGKTPPLPAAAAPGAAPTQTNLRIAAAASAILLGSLGVHKFVLGYTTQGIILLVATLLTCGLGSFVTGIIGIIEGIVYLTKSDEEFNEIYVKNKRDWF
jgi:TM2 domain-containing membrane protein YozV